VTALAAPVAAHRDFQDGRSPAQRLVCESADYAVADQTLTAAAPAPLIRFDNPTGQDGSVGFESLSDHSKAEAVESGEGGQVRAAEPSRRGSVRHVEVFWMRRVGTFIFGRPRHLSADRRASPTYTLIWEESVCGVNPLTRAE
jgi:hypothetical protein